MTKKRILSICLAVVLMMSMAALAGCGSKEEAKEDPKPTNTQELLDLNKKANEDVENYSLTGKGNLELKVSSGDEEMSAPIEFDANADLSKTIIHGKGTFSMTMMGETQKAEPEVYVDLENKKMYGKTADEDSWSTSDMDFDDEDLKVDLPDTIKEKLEFAESDDVYELTCDLTQIDIKDLIKTVVGDKEIDGLDTALEAIDKAEVKIDAGTLKMTYDKDSYLMTSMEIKEFSGSGKYEITEGQSMDVSATAVLDISLSDYNEVPEENFKLPEGVAE